jgi:hypothetical protein
MDLGERALDELSHQNDKRVVVFVCAVVAICYLATRQNPSPNISDAIELISALSMLTVLGISFRPERNGIKTPDPTPAPPDLPKV